MAAPSTSGVVVADDDSMIRGILRSRLTDLGQDVFLAADGEEAVGLASRMPARLVILDLNMPKLNGMRACEQIRALPGYETTPIVILTVNDDPRTKAAAERAGATAFLSKPFRSAPLLEVLSRFLPIAEATMLAIRQSARQATIIASDGLSPAQSRPLNGVDPNGPSNALDHGINILNVLRR